MNALYTLLLIQTAPAQNREQIFCITLLRINVSGWKSLLETKYIFLNILCSDRSQNLQIFQVNIILHCLTFKYNLTCVVFQLGWMYEF